MRMLIERGGRRWALGEPVDLSIPLRFGQAQPNAFHLPEAQAEAFQAGTFVGDTRQGGSANCAVITMAPHGNGTHTESVGHIIDERVAVAEVLSPGLVPATLLTVSLTARATCGEHTTSPGLPEDEVVTAAALQAALEALIDSGGEGSSASLEDWREALLVRTAPNGPEKLTRRYSGGNPAYFTREAMAWVRQRGVAHLLVDLPSVDREEDDGLLEAHHIFWGMPLGARRCEDAQARRRTITEMFYAPPTLSDGRGVVSLQIPAFMLDAAPSRPAFYPVLGESRR